MNQNINYSDLNEETQKYLNMAMNIYSTIQNNDITKKVCHIGQTTQHNFTKLDKKILSLFMAGLMVDGNLKEIFNNYDDIKLKDLLEFSNIDEQQINKIPSSEYEQFYSKNLKLDLLSFIQKKSDFYIVNWITPEVIVSCLDDVTINGSDILNYYGNEYRVGGIWFNEHPIFEALKNYTLMDGSVNKRNFDLPRNSIMFSDFVMEPITEKISNSFEQPKKDQKTSIKIDDNVWDLLSEIQKKFIGQEEACEGLFYNIINNQQLAEMADIPDGQRSIIFLDGPTGTGKTAITREITKKLDIPFTSSSITNYSSTGYKGGDLTDVLKELCKKAGGDQEKAERGIVLFDEFDKIAYSRSGGLEMKRAVQQQLLDFLGGGKYIIRVGDSIFDMKEIEFDTSKLTFVCLGALTDLRLGKTEKKQPMGFEQSNSINNQQEYYSITPQDLIDIGLERELVGRLNTYLHTNDYSKESLQKILKGSTISPMLGFRKWVESRGKKLKVDDEVYEIVAEQAYELNTGARSLQTIMNNIRTYFLKEVLRGNSDTIRLDADIVIKIYDQTMNRRGRV